MTNSTGQVDEIDERLQALERAIADLRNEVAVTREETRINNNVLLSLQGTIAELADIARLHQQALRTAQQNFDRIWRYLENQIEGNSSR
jgi:chromosome segregation ATPase